MKHQDWASILTGIIVFLVIYLLMIVPFIATAPKPQPHIDPYPPILDHTPFLPLK